MTDPVRHLDPIVVGADAWPPVSATFLCDGCGATASTVTLVPPRAADPLAPPAGNPGPDAAAKTIFRDHARLAVDGPLQMTHTLSPAAGTDIGAVEAALRASDPDALHAVDREFAPFRCRECSKSYCKGCWRIQARFDPDAPWWYEDTVGVCPLGHTRLMDD